MKNLYTYLFESFNYIEYSIADAERVISTRGTLTRALKGVINYLYNNSVTSYPMVMSNTDKDKKTIKIQQANWNGFTEYIAGNLNRDEYETKRLSTGLDKYIIDGFTFICGNGSPEKYTDAGDTAGQYAEALVCYFFNNYKQIDVNDKDIMSQINDIENQSGIMIDSSWRQSIARMVGAINTGSTNSIQWTNDNYIAAHIDGRDLERLPEYVTDIAQIYSGKKGCKQVLSQTFNGIPNAKDNWNKADIVLIKRDEDTLIETISNAVKQLGDDASDKTNELNNILNSLVIEGKIIPISLKKLDKDSFRIIGENIPSSGQASTLDVVEAKLVMPTKIDKTGYSGTMWLNVTTSAGVQYNLQFRSQLDTSRNLSIEAQLPGNSSARGGKGVTLIKQAVGITRNDKYIDDFESIDDMCSALMSTGFDIYADSKRVSSASALKKFFSSLTVKGRPAWERTCFGGFTGVFSRFKKMYEKDDEQTVQNAFATCCLNKCALCNGASTFFLIS